MGKTSDFRRATALELFAGAGGLALASKKAGLQTAGLIERDELACATLLANKRALGIDSNEAVHNVALEAGASKNFSGDFDLLIGGPPCQPFSRAGHRQGHRDHRDMFPVFTEFVHRHKPKAFVIENVVGLQSNKCLNYFTKVISSLAKSGQKTPFLLNLVDGVPELGRTRPSYRVYFKILNAADYGVAQNRSRLFIIGLRSDLELEWNWPLATHSRHALLQSKFISKDYFLRHDLPTICRSMGETENLKKVLSRSSSSHLKPHVTVRDALSDLPHPQSPDAAEFLNHVFIPGARSYVGHTGSDWDEPAKTIKAGVHGCPGGENSVKLNKDSIRYFTVRELARLQGFPDHYNFVGTRNQCVRQIGNAVPVELGIAVIKSVMTLLNTQSKRSIQRESHSISSRPERLVARDSD